MIEIIVAALCGLAVGIGGTFGIQATQKKNAAPIVIEDKRGQIEAETVQQLTNLDVTLELCKDDNNKELCRELICYQFATQSASSQGQCESISNIKNKIELYNFCTEQGEDKFDKCIDIFWRRN